MLIVPAEQKLDRAHPPIATLLLLIINCIVYFAYQTEDAQRMDAAVAFYNESGLIKLDAPNFIYYLEDKFYKDDDAITQQRLDEFRALYDADNNDPNLLYFYLHDRDFDLYLKQQEKENAYYAESEYAQQREDFEQLKHKQVSPPKRLWLCVSFHFFRADLRFCWKVPSFPVLLFFERIK